MEFIHPQLNSSNQPTGDAYDDFDYGTIEQIANGLEKMVGSWTLNSQGGSIPKKYNNNSLELDFLEEEDQGFDHNHDDPYQDNSQMFDDRRDQFLADDDDPANRKPYNGESDTAEDHYESDTDHQMAVDHGETEDSAPQCHLNNNNEEYSFANDIGFSVEDDRVYIEGDDQEEVDDQEEELDVIDPLDIPGIPAGKEFHAEIRNDEPPDAMENFKFQLDESITIDDTTLMFSAQETAPHTASSSDSGIYEEDNPEPPNNFELETDRCEEFVACKPEDHNDVLKEKTRSWHADECRSSTSASSSYGHHEVVHPADVEGEEEEEEEEEEDHQSRHSYTKRPSKPAKADQHLDPIRKVWGWKESEHPPAKPHAISKHKLGLRKKCMEVKKDLKRSGAVQKCTQRRNENKPDKFEWTSEFKDSILTSSDMLYSGDGSNNEEMAKQCPSSYSVSLNQELEELRIDHPTGDEELKMDLLAQVKEYEAKLLEMKKKTVQLQSQFQSNDSATFPKQDKSRKTENTHLSSNMEKSEERKLESCKKQIMKLQREKETLIKEIYDLKNKERQFELQRQSLDETQQRANMLQRELIKKEEDLVEWQLREKKADAELHQAEVALQRVQGTYLDPHKILNLVPALCAWLQSLKKIGPVRCEHRQLLQVQHFEASLLKILDECIPMDELQVSLTNSPAVVDIHSIAPYRTNQAISIYDR